MTESVSKPRILPGGYDSPVCRHNIPVMRTFDLVELHLTYAKFLQLLIESLCVLQRICYVLRAVNDIDRASNLIAMTNWSAPDQDKNRRRLQTLASSESGMARRSMNQVRHETADCFNLAWLPDQLSIARVIAQRPTLWFTQR